MTTSTAIMTQQQSEDIKRLLAQNFEAARVVMPKAFSPARMVRIAHLSITQNPFLIRCSQISLVNAVLESYQMGLELNGILGHAYIVPFQQKGVYHAQLMLGYRGMIELAQRSEKVSMPVLHPVWERDEFDYEYGTSMFLRHKPFRGDDPGKLLFAYSMIKYRDGSFDFEVIDQRLADQAKARSQSAQKSFSPWNQADWVPAMWCKTSMRRIAKRIPMSAELNRGLSQEEHNDLGHPAPVSEDLNLANITEPSATMGVGARMTDIIPEQDDIDVVPNEGE